MNASNAYPHDAQPGSNPWAAAYDGGWAPPPAPPTQHPPAWTPPPPNAAPYGPMSWHPPAPTPALVAASRGEMTGASWAAIAGGAAIVIGSRLQFLDPRSGLVPSSDAPLSLSLIFGLMVCGLAAITPMYRTGAVISLRIAAGLGLFGYVWFTAIGLLGMYIAPGASDGYSPCFYSGAGCTYSFHPGPGLLFSVAGVAVALIAAVNLRTPRQLMDTRPPSGFGGLAVGLIVAVLAIGLAVVVSRASKSEAPASYRIGSLRSSAGSASGARSVPAPLTD